MLETLKRYIGTVCEVRNLENELLFPARVMRVVDDLSLSLELASLDGTSLIIRAYDTPVKITLRNSKDGLLVLGGRVYISNDMFWRVSSVSELQKSERRGFFRINATDANGYVSLIADASPGDEHVYPAKVIDVSLSGVKFISEHRFSTTSLLYLSNVVLTQEDLPFNFKCSIHGDLQEVKLGYVYRCSFASISDKETDRLCKVIFTLQRESLKKRGYS